MMKPHDFHFASVFFGATVAVLGFASMFWARGDLEGALVGLICGVFYGVVSITFFAVDTRP